MIVRMARPDDVPRQRPRFHLVVPLPADDVARRLAAGLAATDLPCAGRVASRHAWITIRDGQRHFWSPNLDVEFYELPDGTELRGRFGPLPAVWTMFVFIYAILSTAGMISLVMGLVQLSLDSPPWALAASGALFALIGFVYGAAFIGQGLGSGQIAEIRLFIDRELLRDAHPPASDHPAHG